VTTSNAYNAFDKTYSVSGGFHNYDKILSNVVVSLEFTVNNSQYLQMPDYDVSFASLYDYGILSTCSLKITFDMRNDSPDNPPTKAGCSVVYSLDDLKNNGACTELAFGEDSTSKVYYLRNCFFKITPDPDTSSFFDKIFFRKKGDNLYSVLIKT
jgi:hypothetical protein